MVSRGFTHTPGGDTASVTRANAPTLTYSYDARGRLSSVTSGAAQIASYAYDWREQRVSASSTEVGSRHYLFAEDGQLLAEHDATTGAMLREYVWLDTMPLAMVSGAISTPTYTWITTGNLNEPLLLTNAAGQVTASTTRDPWGNPILLAGGTPLDLGYPGQWRDPATGLFQNWHRDYDPTLGRYAQADPLGLGGGSNVFAYVGGDPVNMIDPMGLSPGVVIGGTVRVVGGRVAAATIGAGARDVLGPIVGGAVACVLVFDCISPPAANVPRPREMTPKEESYFDQICRNSPDPCAALKARVRQALAMAQQKMFAMRMDGGGLFGTPRWDTHGDDLKGRLGSIRSMISLGEKMGCDMSAEKAWLATLSIPVRPN